MLFRSAAEVASISVCSTAQAADADKPQVKVAGYDYDRVRAIMDGQVGIEGAEVSFHYEDIYAVND